MNPAAPILQTTGLVKRFGGLLATDHVSIDVVAGEIHALIGPNGAGKTTLISLLSGEQRPDAGEIALTGSAVTRLDVARRARAGLGRSYQITQVLMEFTALDNVLVGVLSRSRETGAWQPLRAVAAHVDAARQYLEQVGLGHSADVPVVELLAGLKSRYPMLLVEHDMDAVFTLADRISVLVYGKVIATGKPLAIRADAAVKAAYLGDE